MPGRKEVRGGAGVLTLSSAITNSAGSLQAMGSVAGWPTGAAYPFVIKIDPLGAEEKCLCSSLNLVSPATINIIQRGYDGTSAQAHNSGVPIQHCIDADSLDTLFDHVFNTTRDDHTQYMRTDGTRGFTGLPAIAGTPTHVGTAIAPGSALTLARSDHVHDIGPGSIWDPSLFVPGVITEPILAAGAVSQRTLGPDVYAAGLVVDFAGSVAPFGWLMCDGSAVSRTTYARLFAAIGTTWGPGDGSTTFNLPDLRGRVTAAPDGGANRLTANNTLAAVGGAESRAIAAAEMPVHSHGPVTVSMAAAGGHSHQPSDPTYNFAINKSGVSNTPSGNAAPSATIGLTFTGTTDTTPNHIHDINAGVTGNAGSGAAHANTSPYAILNKIIKF